MPEEEIRRLGVSAIHARAQEAARRLNLPADASRAQLVSALARSRVIEPTLPRTVDDSHDLEDVFRFIPPQGLGVPPSVGARPTAPILPSRQPRYTIRVHAVLCADSDGKNAVTHSNAELVKVIEGLSSLYYQAGLSFVLSNVTALPDTMINQDFTIPDGLDYSSENEPMTQQQTDATFAEHNAKRNEWAAARHGEMVIFFRYGTKFVRNEWLKVWEVQPASLSFSGKEHEFVAINSEKVLEETLLAHESGHYFHLDHTFGNVAKLTKEEKALYPEPSNPADRDSALALLRASLAEIIRSYVDDNGNPAENGLDVFNADGLADTPPDPGTAIFEYENYGKGCDGGTITVDVNLKSGVRSYSITACVDMLMSYYFRCPGMKRFSELQMDRIRRSLEQVTFTLPVLSRHHLIATRIPRPPIEFITFPRRILRTAGRWLGLGMDH